MINLDKFISHGSAVLVCTDVNRRYLSGFNSSSGYLLLTDCGNFLFVDSRYFEAAEKQAREDIKPVLLERFSRQLNEYTDRFGIKTLYTETGITVAMLESLKGISNAEVTADAKLTEAIEFARSVKTEKEIENIVAAQRIAEETFSEALNFIKAGVTEREVALFLDFGMQEKGSEGVSFETIAVSGKNSSLPHGVPSDKKIEDGDFVTLDFGAVFGGYHSDMTRTVAVGHVTEKQEEIYSIVLSAQKAALEKIKYGIPAMRVDAAARDIIAEKGFAGNFGHGTGHGVGLEIHEYPSVGPNSKKPLVENQIITVEPGIYIPDLFGVRIEDMAVVKRSGSINLTNAEKSLIIL